jgi:hypothetical protein
MAFDTAMRSARTMPESRDTKPPRSNSRKRGHVLAVRLDDEEHALFEALFSAYRGSVEARVYGDSPGGFLRYVMFGRQARPVRRLVSPKSAHPSANELILLRNDIALALSNANQIARGLNRHQLPVPEDLRDVINGLAEAASRIKATLNPATSNDNAGADFKDDRQGQKQG